MIVPLPAWLLDAGLAVNLALAAALLVASLTVRDPLQVTAFPTLLLVTTLLRLALNVSSTRLALAEGFAGNVIQAFGEFVVRGDYVVGAVIFSILALVQFLVVAKGAERVAEVSARFTLDAMPGKQMSIDADLRAGAIDQATARARRRALERESQMFGAMDGAMKFVKGDVIAGLIIVLVNLVGGTLVGVLQNKMDFSEALSTYALIAIGDGLVSQLPSLCIAVAAGMVVTRVSSDQPNGSLGSDIGRQFFGQARALYVVGGLCAALALVPGMPRLTFVVLGAALGAAGHRLQARREEQQVSESRKGTQPSEPLGATAGAGAPASPSDTAAGVAPLTLDLAQDLAQWAHGDGMRFVRQELGQLRERVYLELGVKVPGIRVRTGLSGLPPGGYVLLVDELPVAQGQLAAEKLYVAMPPEELTFLGLVAEPAVDPLSKRAMAQLDGSARGTLEAAGLAVHTAKELMLAHLAHVVRQKASRFLGVQEVQALLQAFEPVSPVLVKTAQDKVPLPLLTDVLRKLVEEDVSIRDLRTVLETLVLPTTEGDAVALSERCRQGLAPYLSHKYAPAGLLYAHLVDPTVEEVIREQTQRGAAAPERVNAVLEAVQKLSSAGRAVILAAPDIRRPLKKLCEGVCPDLAVLTYGELKPDQRIHLLGRLAA
jgi:type III secretion protein V